MKYLFESIRTSRVTILAGLPLILLSTAFAEPAHDRRYSEQYQRSFQYILDNIQNPEVPAGAVIASPSRNAPNYFYHWVRDAGLTMLEISYQHRITRDASVKQKLEKILWDWISFESRIQEKAEASSNLGEPLFTVTGEIYPHPWGRPQNDGPAIRALAMIHFAQTLLQDKRTNEAKKLYNKDSPKSTPITRDLQYLFYHWRNTCYDLWEEIEGQHFFTRMAQREAMRQGAELAAKMLDARWVLHLSDVERSIDSALQAHLDSGRKLILPTLDRSGGIEHKKSQLDIAVLLGSLYFAKDDDLFSPQDPIIKTYADQLETSFKNTYPVNSRNPDLGTAIGRYPEDIYNGSGTSEGNPWFLATHAYAEYYCRLADKAKKPEEQASLRKRGQQFLDRALFHADTGGRMAEQFSRHNGFTQGARDLTWSYVSYLRAYRACTSNLK
jgi:glucoamylase